MLLRRIDDGRSLEYEKRQKEVCSRRGSKKISEAISRTNPLIRDNRVMPATVPARRFSGACSSSLDWGLSLSRLIVDLHFLWGSLQNPTYFPVDIFRCTAYSRLVFWSR